MPERIIYDFGMNNGDDVEYYLLKADRVVGLEANESLCALVRKRFPDAVESGRLIVLNAALTDKGQAEPVTFYRHDLNHVLSQLPRPADAELHQFTPVQVPCRTPSSIIREFGSPHYVKIDVEHFDLPVLKEIFAAGIYPPEISAESHSVGVFACLVDHGYAAFNLVDGASVPTRYGQATIQTAEGLRPFRFRPHSAGPFGEDIVTHWEGPDSFFYRLACEGLGWKDIHASRVIQPVAAASHKDIAIRQLLAASGKIFGGLKRRVTSGLRN